MKIITYIKHLFILLIKIIRIVFTEVFSIANITGRDEKEADMVEITGYDDLEDKQEKVECRKLLKGLQKELGGDIIKRKDDGVIDFMYLSFIYNSRNCRVKINPDWGTPELQLKMNNSSSCRIHHHIPCI